MTGRSAAWIPCSVLLGIIAALPVQRILELMISSDGSIEKVPYGVGILTLRIMLAGAAVLLAVFRPRNTTVGKLVLGAFSLVVCLALGEVVVRLVYAPEAYQAGWRSGASDTELNELGFRGQSIRYGADDMVVVLVGDSQAAAMACAYAEIPERRLEHYLTAQLAPRTVKVFTIGAEGYGQDQQLLVLREYFERYRADIVLLWQTFNNDVWNNVFPTHWPANGMPKPTFRLQNGELVGPNVPMAKRMRLRSALRVVDLVWNTLFGFEQLDEEWEKYLPTPYEPLEQYTGPVNTNWQYRWARNIGLMRDENLRNEKSHLAVLLSPRSSRMQYGLDLTRALLSAIEDLVATHSGRFCIFTTQAERPAGEDDSEIYMLNGLFYRVSAGQRYENQEYVNSRFRVVRVPVTIKDRRVGPADGHLNKRAVDQVMRDLAQKLSAEM